MKLFKKIALPVIILSIILCVLITNAYAASYELDDSKDAYIISATNEKAEHEIFWNSGYIAAPAKKATEFYYVTSSTTYYSDVIKLEKAGTKITFEDSSSFLNNNAYLISSWKFVDGKWKPDPYKAKYIGVGDANSIIQTKQDDKMTYTYISSEDNECIRICYKLGDNDSLPKIYSELTNEQGTYAKELEVENYPTKLLENGTLDKVIWTYGYVGSTEQANGYANKTYIADQEYCFSNIIILPKKGTTLLFQDSESKFADETVFVFSVWKKDEVSGRYVVDTNARSFNGHNTEDKLTVYNDNFAYSQEDDMKGNMIYSYTSQSDNEAIRICYRCGENGLDPNLQIKWDDVNDLYESPIRMSRIFTPGTYEATNGYFLRYRLFVPEDYTPSKEYPVIIFLHGAGQVGDNNLSQLTLGIFEPFKDKNNPINQCIVLAPQCASNSTWGDIDYELTEENHKQLAESKDLAAILEFLDELDKTYRLDRDRFYVTGLSMGGYGTWRFITEYPDVFAAAMPLCGGCDPSKAELVLDIPIKIYHGKKDSSIPIEEEYEIYERILELGGTKASFITYQNEGHGIWNKTYSTDGVFEWLLAQKLSDRIPTPPINDPTADPTIDPTTDPTTDPTVDPTTDPTVDPGKEPTNTGLIIGIIAGVVVIIAVVVVIIIKKKK